MYCLDYIIKYVFLATEYEVQRQEMRSLMMDFSFAPPSYGHSALVVGAEMLKAWIKVSKSAKYRCQPFVCINLRSFGELHETFRLYFTKQFVQ